LRLCWAAALHNKALVFDRRATFVGSFNLDPRSAVINSEIGLLVESPALAAEVASFLDEGVQPVNSYRVTLDDDHDLRWTTVKNGEIVTFDHEPETSLWKRFSADMLKLLPIEGQL
jgi:putative cardiolipin synthase